MSNKPDQKLESSNTEDSDSQIRYINLYESDDKIYTRKITGFYQRLRRYTGIPLMLGFLLMPWLVIDGRPAMLFDLPERQFHVLWMTFWPQDGMLLGWLLMIAAFALFTVTVLVGRVWCGFTCPQTVWTLMFIWAEHLCEGDRNKRIKLDKQGWSVEKVLRKGAKHGLWLLIALVTGLTFIGYFTPIKQLVPNFLTLDAGLITSFWVLFFTGATYLNAGWMREQVCKYMCPYARFQSVMYDKDTLSVTYDAMRGETRGPRKPNEDYKANGKGDCIDCSWCVQVCPVDIDIREGAQYECIDCGLCVDACDQVMDKMGYEKRLIRFTTEDELENGKTKVLRPRLIGYATALAVMVGLFTYTIANRVAISADVSRDRGARMYRVKGDQIQNVYSVKITNMDNKPHTYEVAVQGQLEYRLKGFKPLELAAGEVFSQPVRVSVSRSEISEAKNPIYFIIRAREDDSLTTTEQSNFMGPEK